MCVITDEYFFPFQALTKFQSSQKITTKTGIDQEDALLNESAAMETSLNLQILDLENEVKQLRHDLDRATNERDRMLQENAEMGQNKSDTESEKMKLKVSFVVLFNIQNLDETVRRN